MNPHSFGEGPVTIVFTDMERSTDVLAAKGNKVAQGLNRAHNEIVRSRINAHKGHELRSLGDGFKIAFNSVSKAIAFSIDTLRTVEEHNRLDPQSAFQIRVGINTGEAIEEEGDLFGTAVNAAARISAKARGGQILVSEVVKQLTAGSIPESSFVDMGRFRLKGFPDRWRLYEVAWRESPSMMGPPPRTEFVGREGEKEQLITRLESAMNGRGSLVVVGGEPGVGKTRLAEEVSAVARSRRALAFMGRCYEFETIPYVPLIEIMESVSEEMSTSAFRSALGQDAPEVARVMPQLRSIFRDIPESFDVKDPEQERRSVLNGLRDFILRMSETRPLVLVLDDIQWADESTLMLMEHIAEHLDESSLFVIATYRDVGLEVRRPLARSLETMMRRRLAHRLSLKRFPQEAVEAMLESLAGRQPPPSLVKVIYEDTDGNPFFVEEVFKHLYEEGRLFDESGDWLPNLSLDLIDVPESVKLVIGRRLERLGDDGRKILTGAAVLGRNFDFRVLEELSDADEDTVLDVVDEAERAGLIHQTTTEHHDVKFGFAHELIRSTLLGEISLPRRQRLHLRAAEAIEKTLGNVPDQNFSELAHHLYQAGAAADPGKSIKFLLIAGDQAMASAAFEEALRQFENASSVSELTSGTTDADILYKIGLAERSLGHAEEAVATWRKAIDIYESMGNKETAAHLCLEASFQLLWIARVMEAGEMAARGLAALGDTVNKDRAYLLAVSGTILSMGGFFEQADGMIGEASAVAAEDDQRLAGIVLSGKCINNYFHFRPRDAAEYADRAAELLRDAGALWDLAQMEGFRSWAYFFMGSLTDAVTIAREASKLSHNLGHTGGIILTNRTLSLARFLKDPDLRELEEFAHEDLSLGRGRVGWVADSYTWLGIADLYRGDWDRALERFVQGAEKEPVGAEAGRNWSFLLMHRAYSNMVDEFTEMVDEQIHSFPTRESVSPRGAWMRLFGAIEGSFELGVPYEQDDWYELVLEAISYGNMGRIFDFRLLETIAGMAASVERRWDQVDGHFQKAIELAADLPHVVEQAEARRLYSRALLERNDPTDRDKAAELLAQAEQLYARVGMPRHLELTSVLRARV